MTMFSLRTAIVCVFTSGLFVSIAGFTVLAGQRTGPACAETPYHAFDFWIGDWDVFEIGNSVKVAHARIDSILNGCVLLEDYRGSDGYEGQSFTIYDSTRNVWHQTWVTTQGALLEIEGKAENGRIILSGSNQKGELIRGTWEPASEGVHEIAVKSLDGGKTWQPWFDIMFQAHGAMDEAPGDEDEDAKKTVAALDSEYQSAVKHNDAQTMDRILADDFVLVTSSGKTYSKSDLIQDAKSGRATYEHQEDTDKTVRLWGDTAIVTANLWEKGVQDGKPFEHRLWFSDVYRRTPAGWRYVFAQSAYRPN